MKIDVKGSTNGAPNTVMNTMSHIDKLDIQNDVGGKFAEFFTWVRIKITGVRPPSVTGARYVTDSLDPSNRLTEGFELRGRKPSEMDNSANQNAPCGHKAVIRENYIEIDGVKLDAEQMTLTFDVAQLIDIELKGVRLASLDVEIDGLVLKP